MSNNNFIVYQAPNISHQAFFLHVTAAPLVTIALKMGKNLLNSKLYVYTSKIVFQYFPSH